MREITKMTLEYAKKNIKIMNYLNQQFVKIGHEKTKKILNLLLQNYANDSEDCLKDMQLTLTCLKKLLELEKNEAEACLKYLVDLHIRPEFDKRIETDYNE